MISNYKKKEYLNQVDILLSAISIGKANGEDLKEYKKALKKLKREIEEQNDITLEEIMEPMEPERALSFEGRPETSIMMQIEEIRAQIPEQYVRMAIFEQDRNLPSWLETALTEYPEWRYKCIESLAQDLQNTDYARIVYSIHEMFAYLPLEERQSHPELCKSVVGKDLEMLKYVPIDVIRSNVDDWIEPFYEKGIDIKLFVEYDEKIRRRIGEDLTQIGRFPDLSKRNPKKQMTEKEAKKQMTEKEAKKQMKFMEDNEVYEGIRNIPIDILRKNEDWYKRVCAQGDAFKYIPGELKVEDQQWCIEQVNREPTLIGSVPASVIMDNFEWCKGVVERKPNLIRYIPNSVKLTQLSWFKSVMTKKQNQIKIMKFPLQIEIMQPIWKKIILLNSLIITDRESDREDAYRAFDAYRALEKYKKWFYGPEINIKRMQEQYSPVATLDRDTRLRTIQDRAPIFSGTYQAIEQMDERFQDSYRAKANSLHREYERLMENKGTVSASQLSDMINSVAMLEMEVRTANHELMERQKAEEAYAEMKADMEGKIAQIKGINPEIAKKYSKALKKDSDENIEYRVKTGMPSSQEIALSNNIDFYIGANIPREEGEEEQDILVGEQEQAMVVYEEPKKRGIFSRLAYRLGLKSDKPKYIDTSTSQQASTSRQTIEEPQYVEPEEFRNMSLEELKEQMKILQREVEQREDATRSSNQPRGEDE